MLNQDQLTRLADCDANPNDRHLDREALGNLLDAFDILMDVALKASQRSPGCLDTSGAWDLLFDNEGNPRFRIMSPPAKPVPLSSFPLPVDAGPETQRSVAP